MVKRKVLDGRVLGVEYSLTPLGESLQGPFSINIGAIQDCQHRYDEQNNRIEH
jgi:DNA-binding HxlR family transcriptional regulator